MLKEQVIVVGAGPSGLAAARHLQRVGLKVQKHLPVVLSLFLALGCTIHQFCLCVLRLRTAKPER